MKGIKPLENNFRGLKSKVLSIKGENMRKTIILGSLIILMGCKTGGKPFKLMNFQAAEEIKAADKITGIESLKAADKIDADLEAQAGYKNTISKSEVGGNLTNDSEVIKSYIEANKELNNKIATIYLCIISGLLSLLLTALTALIFVVKSMLRARNKDDALEEKRMDMLLSKINSGGKQV